MHQQLVPHCLASPTPPSQSPQPPLIHTPIHRRNTLILSLASIAAPLLHPLGTLKAHAENVRLQDVKSPALQAGLRAATEGRWADAERLFQIVLAEEPNLGSVWSNLGNVHLQQGRLQEALQDYTRAVELAGQAPVPYVNRALAHESLALATSDPPTRRKELLAALDDLAIAVKLDPQEFTAFFNRGNVLLRMGEYTAAAASFTQAADLAPGIAGYRLRAGTLYYQMGDTARALSTVRGVLRRNPRYPEAHLVLAVILWGEGQRAAAEEEYALATGLDDDLGGDMDTVRRVTLWPPKLYDGLSKFREFSLV